MTPTRRSFLALLGLAPAAVAVAMLPDVRRPSVWERVTRTLFIGPPKGGVSEYHVGIDHGAGPDMSGVTVFRDGMIVAIGRDGHFKPCGPGDTPVGIARGNNVVKSGLCSVMYEEPR